MNEYPLTQLYFYLTEGCNLACRHCWLAPKLDTQASRYPVLAVDHFVTAIREAKPLGLTTVKLTGGEPLLHPQIRELLAIVVEEQVRLVVETNGVLVTPAMVDAIAAAPHPFVSVSLDGADAPTHEWVRGIEGSFVAAVQGVRLLAEAGLKPQVIFSIMRHNAGQVEAIIALAEALGAASVKFNVVQPTARGEQLHARDGALGIGKLIDLGRRVDTVLALRTPLRLVFDYPQAFQPLGRLAGRGGSNRCGIKHILGVLASGHYALCGIGTSVPELIFGQVSRDALADVWQGNRMLNELRAALPARLTGICGECLMKERCLGSCLAQNYYRARSLTAPFWFCEQAEAAGLFPASRRVKRAV